MSILQIETLACNVASSFDINYLDVLSKTGITQDIHIFAIEKLLQTINVELTNSKTLDTVDTIWRLMWEPNFADDIGGHLTHGKYYYLCINNYRLKCIRDKTVELYNMKQTNSTKKNSSKAPVETPVAESVTTTNVEPNVVVEVAAPLNEKKKRAPSKKKDLVEGGPGSYPEPDVTADSVIAPSEKKKKGAKAPLEPPATDSAAAPVVSEKKKRAPAKKKEPVVNETPAATEGEAAPIVSEKKKRAPAKKKEPIATETPATEGEVAPAVTTSEPVVTEKKKRAPAKKKEPVTTTNETPPVTEGDVAPVVTTSDPVVTEKKKRAPAKKKEPVVTETPSAEEEVTPAVNSPTPATPEPATASEKKKRAPVKKA
jgi:hypothetical protein